MFGTKAKNSSPASKSGNLIEPVGATCIIGEGTVIEGNFTTTEDLRLDGKMIGDLKIDKRLVMGPNGKIDGQASCTGSSINGEIDGEITVDGTLHLSGTASVNGKICARKFVVDEGAKYSGECLIGEQYFK